MPATAPLMPWRVESSRLAAVVPFVESEVVDEPELLLDERFTEADGVTVEPGPAPDSAAALLARLEAGLARRGARPVPDARLRESLARAANG